MTKFIINSVVVLQLVFGLTSVDASNVYVNEKTNDAKITVSNVATSEDDTLIRSQIYKEVTDNNGNTKWIEDDGSYADRGIHVINNKKKYIQISWICGNPDTPSTRFKIILTNKNKKILEEIFEVKNPIM